MEPSESSLSLPPGVSEAGARDTARKYAPDLRFYRHERHFPSDPGRFRISARYRASLPGLDRGWNHRVAHWVGGDADGASYEGAPWDQIAEQCLKNFPSARPIEPPTSPNLRPRDGKNRYGTGNIYGLFLQRSRRLPSGSSGMKPTESGVTGAPLFVDTRYDADRGLVHVLYWFFYELNWWKAFITHEGDWEHVTLVFTVDDFKTGGRPFALYLAQHNTGVALDFDKTVSVGETHPVIYVDTNGHPCHTHVDHPGRYPIRWRTWTASIEFIARCDWRDFAGAWGKVGASKHTTGPLGPFFKRHEDKVRITFVRGKPCVPFRKG